MQSRAPGDVAINATSVIGTNGTLFNKFTTNNMGQTSPSKISSNSDELRPKSPTSDKNVFGTRGVEELWNQYSGARAMRSKFKPTNPALDTVGNIFQTVNVFLEEERYWG